MKSSPYLNWFRRLLILGAVVAGVSASTAGAVVQSEGGGSVAAQHSTPLGLKADGLRLQGIAQVYKSLSTGSFPTAQGLKADGLRWQGIAQVYHQLQPTLPDVLERYATAHPYGTPSTPDVVERYATAHPFGNGIGIGAVSSTSAPVAASQPTAGGFDWADYAIGIGSGIGVVFILAAGLAMGLHRRHRMQTA